MKDYIKPTFILAGLAPIALAGSGGCDVTKNDLESIVTDWGITEVDKALGLGEECTYKIDMYCKFTAVENGAIKALSS